MRAHPARFGCQQVYLTPDLSNMSHAIHRLRRSTIAAETDLTQVLLSSDSATLRYAALHAVRIRCNGDNIFFVKVLQLSRRNTYACKTLLLQELPLTLKTHNLSCLLVTNTWKVHTWEIHTQS